MVIQNSKTHFDARTKAAVGTSPHITFINENNTPVTEIRSSFVNVRLTSPWSQTENSLFTHAVGMTQSDSDVLANVSTTFQVMNGVDDVNEVANEYLANQGTVFLGNAGTSTGSWTGFRFNNISIPRGAKVTSAQLLVYNPTSQWITMRFALAADKTANSAAFSINAKPSGRTLTNARVSHSSNVQWSANRWYALDDISPVVQEVINQSGWQQGNSLSLLVRGTGSLYGRKNITSYEGNKTNAPRLVISYTTNDTSLPTLTPTRAPIITTAPPTATTVPPTKTNTPVPVTATPVPYTVSVELAEDPGFSKNYVSHPYTVHPMKVTYAFSTATPGQKIIYARFTSSTGQQQVFSNWIDLVAPPTLTPTPTTPPTGGHTEHGENSHAMGRWSPNLKYDTCTVAEHDSYKVMGPDGKWYPTWHPPVHVRANGTTCTLGHEHGRDPAASNLLQFLKETYGYDADKNGRVDGAELATAGVPFGYVNEQLDVWNASKGITNGMRHEDHVGHKIEWENNLMRQWSTSIGGGSQQRGPDSGVRCNFFMKIHQGTHSKDAFTNNMHELIQGYDCTDGIRMANAQMLLFGRAGGFIAGRNAGSSPYFQYVGDPTPPNSPSSGSNVIGRAIGDLDAVVDHILVPQGSWSLFSDALYEDWISGNYVELPNGTDLAYYDPHFAVFGPSRFYWDGDDQNTYGITRSTQDRVDNMGRSVDVCFMNENNGAERARGGQCEWMTNYGQIKSMAWDDPRSAFNGVKREFYFNNLGVYGNATGGNTVWYADPFGKNAQTTPFVGSVKHYLKPKNDPAPYPYPFESNAIGAERNYGGNGVHAPN